ncbi:MAG: primosomal protein N' [Clostridium sp.]
MFFYAGIVINNISVHIDRIFTYEIPDALVGVLDVGNRVKVPFGKGNKIVEGFVMEMKESFLKTDNIKEINLICDENPLLSYEDVEIVRNIRDRYLCTYIEAIRLMLPPGILRGMKKKTTKLLYVGRPLEEKYLKSPYDEIFQLVSENSGKYTKSELSKMFSLSLSSINTLLKHNFICSEEIQDSRANYKEFEYYKKRSLKDFQKNAIDTILYNEKKKFLIHGVTGSGKTEIYLNLVEYYLKENKESIILVPEISLTPQMVERIKGRFGKNVAVFHSKLSDGERFDEWMRVKEGKAKIAIGARSALFLPFRNLGLIVIDEEHESSYKSESSPKYNSKEVAFMKSDLSGCKVVLGSATPSLESYNDALENKIQLISLKNRVNNRPMPEIKVVDMREELLGGNKSIFSRSLYKSIVETIKRKEQIILFLNRRGFSSFISCRQCGFVYKCDNCDISLTYHNSTNKLVCHYCGATKKPSNLCPSCKSKYIKQFGVGTEKVEQEIHKYFPNIKTLRMDFDTTRKKNSHEDIYNSFKNGEADVLIGTQMIAKGLDFENVTLVGVLAADLSLNLPDYRSSERTFQIITQVAGRAGRGDKKGNVIIQTYSPNEVSIQKTVTNDYESFIKEEIRLRYNMNYPPFSKLLVINVTSLNEQELIKAMNLLSVKIDEIVSDYKDIVKLGPCSCGICKIKNQYRWQIILKGNLCEELNNKIKNLSYRSLKSVKNTFKISLDINPNTLV